VAYIGLPIENIFQKLEARIESIVNETIYFENEKKEISDLFDDIFMKLYDANPGIVLSYDLPEGQAMIFNQEWVQFHNQIGLCLKDKYENLNKIRYLELMHKEVTNIRKYYSSVYNNIRDIVSIQWKKENKKIIPIDMMTIDLNKFIRTIHRMGLTMIRSDHHIKVMGNDKKICKDEIFNIYITL
jgi:hypothetical protein